MAPARHEAQGFLASLFDFGFTSFITLKFLRVIYTALVAVILLVGAVLFVALLARGGGSILVALVFVPLLTLLYLVVTRVSLEIVALLFRIGENTSLLVSSSPGWPPVTRPESPIPPTGPAPPTAAYPGWSGQPPVSPST